VREERRGGVDLAEKEGRGRNLIPMGGKGKKREANPRF